MADIEKLDGKSMDIVSENITKLKEIFPDVFSEGKVDFEALEATLGEYVERDDERYSFNWSGKAKARRIAQTPSTGTLRPAKEESKDWDTTENLYIEGDNLEVLKLLQKSYHKQVKMIYIDPPYNTGKEFIYPDNYQDNLNTYLEYTGQRDDKGRKFGTNAETSGRYHTNWLNMMYPRLKLARNLLKDDGVIFISIDDNEVANLRKLCDEIFGEDNFISNVIWEKKFSPQNDAKWFSDNHDHIIVYAKNKEIWRPNLLPRTEEQDSRYSNADNDPRGNWTSGDLLRKDVQKTGLYTIITPSGREVKPPSGRSWRVPEYRLHELVSDNRIWFGQDGNNVPRLKRFLTDVKDGIVPLTIFKYSDVGHNQEAQQEIRKLFDGKSYFDTPKPVRLIGRLLHLGTSENDIILDFFSGSATTAHSVMKLNSENSGNRKYICVQLPEETDKKSEAYKAGYKNICEIGKERIQRAGEKIKSDNPDKDLSDLDIGFKVFKLDSSNIRAWDPESEDLEQSLFEAVNNIKSDRTEEDLLYEILLKYGLDLTLPIEEIELAGKKVYVVGSGALVICLDEEITLDTVEAIAKLKEQYEADYLMRVVFRDNGFKDAEVKTNAIQILKQSGIDDVKSL